MLTIRPIADDELSAFLAVQPDPERAADQAAYVDRMFAGGAMRPEWCYVATDGRRYRRALRVLVASQVGCPDLARPDRRRRTRRRDGSPAPRSPTRSSNGRVKDALAGSPDEFGYVLDEPEQTPQWQDDPDERAGWLERAGFEVVRSTSRWSYEGPPPKVGSRLTFRTYEEAGEAAFLGALEAVSSATLDARVEADRDRLGAAAEAQSTLEDVRALEVQPGWWQLAYDSSGALVGLVMPARAPAMTTIGYIGVVPSQRGRGYVDDLLARGTAILRHDVPDMVVRTDTDLANAPMAAAFERAGYEQFATRREFELSTLNR